MSTPNPGSVRMDVEASGWDAEGRFFVEHSNLLCTEGDQKLLPLRHSLKIHSLVFIRVLHADNFGQSYPRAHHVQKIAASEQPGFKEFHLTSFPPLHNGENEPKESGEHRIGVCAEVKP